MCPLQNAKVGEYWQVYYPGRIIKVVSVFHSTDHSNRIIHGVSDDGSVHAYHGETPARRVSIRARTSWEVIGYHMEDF